MICPAAGICLGGGESPVKGALRELAEELGINARPEDLQYITTFKTAATPGDSIVNNEFEDIYLLKTNKTVAEMVRQEEEVTEIFYVTRAEFKKMVESRDPELVPRYVEYNLILKLLEQSDKSEN